MEKSKFMLKIDRLGQVALLLEDEWPLCLGPKEEVCMELKRFLSAASKPRE
jgi:hypothetical protein